MVTARPAVVLALALGACAPTPPPRPGTHHASDADVTVTRVAHAGVLIEFGATRFLADPWFHESALARPGEPLGLRPDALPPLAAVLLTAADATHADARALAILAAEATALVAPPAVAATVRDARFADVRPLAPWTDTAFGEVIVTAIPGETAGYVLQGPHAVVVLAGAGTNAADAAAVARRVGPITVALVPLTTVDRAAAVAAALAPRRVIPIAYGAAGIVGAAAPGATLDAFRHALVAAAGGDDMLVPLETGESWHYYR